MSAVTERSTAATSGIAASRPDGPPPSPAGPADEARPTPPPPGPRLPPAVQGLGFAMRPLGFNLGLHRRFGDVWSLQLPTRRDGFVVSCHPDHLESLLKARPDDAPSLTGESPLRPILGADSILTSVGERHMRQRKLLLPPFHGDAVARYVEMIADVVDREIDAWPLGAPLALAPRMQAVTLEVIMRGVFGMSALHRRGTIEARMRQTVRRLLRLSTHPLYQLLEMRHAGSAEPRGALAAMLAIVDRQIYALIRQRRGETGGDDVLSLLLTARDEHGEPLSDGELRDELMSLVLAGHETTANSLAWTVERLLRTPHAHDRLRDEVRAGRCEEYVEATIHEGMRNRPVIPMIVRRVMRRWRFGDHVLPAHTPVAVSIIALHHRADVYPQPATFAPERFLARKPGTYTWIPFGGGIRRCLGASLAMAEQRVVLDALARRTDLAAPDARPARARMRNVTMIPADGCRVVVTHRYAA